MPVSQKTNTSKKYPGVARNILRLGRWAVSHLEDGQGGREPPLQPAALELQSCVSHMGTYSIQGLLRIDKSLPCLFASAAAGAGDGTAFMVTPMLPRVGWRGKLGKLQSSFVPLYAASHFCQMRESGPQQHGHLVL